MLFLRRPSRPDGLAVRPGSTGRGGCGTSLIGGVGIAFANFVRRGYLGAMGATGTDLQEFTSQVHTIVDMGADE